MCSSNDDQQKDKLNSVLLQVRSVDVFAKFAPAVVAGPGRLISFEQAVVFSLDAKGTVVDGYFLNVPSSWADAYFEYYIQLADTVTYNQASFPRAISWKDVPRNEFVRNCIQNRKLHYSIHFLLSDTRGRTRSVYSLDRVQNVPFSQDDLEILKRLDFPVSREELESAALELAKREHTTLELIRSFFGADLAMLARDVRQRKVMDWVWGQAASPAESPLCQAQK